jgi:lysozyme family protein
MSDLAHDAFLSAFNHAMLYEVGKFWDPTDPEVIAGLISTKQQKRKVGFVNIKGDRGGVTKYGIAQNSHPNIDITALDLAGAQDIYYREYWLTGLCPKLQEAVAVIHFDGCVNHGPGRARKFLQQSVNAAVDGLIGNKTLDALAATPEEEIINNLSHIRIQFYKDIVNNDPSQSKFINGWLNRISEVTDYAKTLV